MKVDEVRDRGLVIMECIWLNIILRLEKETKTDTDTDTDTKT